MGVISFGDSLAYTPVLDALLDIQGLPLDTNGGQGANYSNILGVDFVSNAIGGTTAAEWLSGAPPITPGHQGITNGIIPFIHAGRTKHIVAIILGVNDFLDGSRTGAAIFADLSTMVSTLQTAGFIVILSTVTNASYANDSRRTDLNTLIRNDGGGLGYTVADPGGDAHLGQTDSYQNLTYYADGSVHFTATGKAIQAGYFKTALLSIGL